MESYRLKNVRFTAIQVSANNIEDIYTWLSPIYKTTITKGLNVARVVIETSPYHLIANNSDFIAMDITGQVIVRNEEEFNRYFVKV